MHNLISKAAFAAFFVALVVAVFAPTVGILAAPVCLMLAALFHAPNPDGVSHNRKD